MEIVSKWISQICPLIWEILNRKAKNNLPKGISEFLNSDKENENEVGKLFFSIMEESLNKLSLKISRKEINDKYKNAFSAVNRNNN